MTEARDGRERREDEEPVGSLAEEAARLFEALHGVSGTRAAGGRGVTDATGALWQELNQHLATGGDCCYCPVCQLIGLVRQPEVRGHLVSAGRSLAAALANALATPVPEPASDESNGSQSHDEDGAV